MKKYLIIICFLTCWLGTSAQNLREVWINMPDTISPYLNKNLRTELVDDVKMGVAVLSNANACMCLKREKLSEDSPNNERLYACEAERCKLYGDKVIR